MIKLKFAGRFILSRLIFLISNLKKFQLENHKKVLTALKKHKRRKKPKDSFLINIIEDLNFQRDQEPVNLPPGAEEPIFIKRGEIDLDISNIKINLIIKNIFLNYYKNNK